MVIFVLSCSEVLELWLINRIGNSCVLSECEEAKSGVRVPGRWKLKPPRRPLKSGENVSGTLQVLSFLLLFIKSLKQPQLSYSVCHPTHKSIWEHRQQTAAAVTIGTEEGRRAQRWQHEAEQPQTERGQVTRRAWGWQRTKYRRWPTFPLLSATKKT